MTQSRTLIQRYSAALLIIAHILLLLNLLAGRAAMIRITEEAYFSFGFGMVLVGAGILIGITVWANNHGWLQHFTQKSRLAIIGWIVLSLGVVASLPRLVGFGREYVPPLLLWLTLFNLAIFLLAFELDFAKIPIIRILKNISIVALIIFIPLLLLELGLRFWIGYFGSTGEKVAYLYSVDEIVQLTSPLRGVPYINYTLAPNYEGHNGRGYRGPDIDSPKPQGTFRIFALGGSTTYGIDVPADKAYPTELQRILRENYGYTKVEVINAGVIAYNSYDLLANFAYHVLDDEPDMIIIYEAINDVTARLVDPRYYNGLNLVRGVWSPNNRQLPPFALMRFIGINAGLIENPNNINWAFNNASSIYRCDNVEFCEPLNMTPQEVLDANPPIYFQRNLSNLLALAQQNNVKVMISSWAYFPEISNGNPYMTNAFVQNGIAQHNAITRQLAEDFELPYYDLAANMPVNADYWLDGMHMTTSGTTEQARQYAAFLVENNLIPDSAK